MLKIKVVYDFFVFFCFLCASLSCSNNLPLNVDCLSDLSQYEGSGLRYFWITDLESNTESVEPFILRASGTNIEVYTKQGIENPLVTENKISSLQVAFDNNIFSRVNTFYGVANQNFDTNQKIKILLYPFNNIGILAFVSSTDFFSTKLACSIMNKASNVEKIIYMNTDVSLDNKRTQWSIPNLLLSTLAHEYQHVLSIGSLINNFILLLERQARGEVVLESSYNLYPSFQIWIDEGFSEIASDIAGYGPQENRLANFACLARRESLVRWSNEEGSYDHVYLFFRYLFSRLECLDNAPCNFAQNVYSAFIGDNIENGQHLRLNALVLFEKILEKMKFDDCNPKYSDIFLPNLTCMYEHMWANFLSNPRQNIGSFSMIKRNLNEFTSDSSFTSDLFLSKYVRNSLDSLGKHKFLRVYENCSGFGSLLPPLSEPQVDLFDFDLFRRGPDLFTQKDIRDRVCGVNKDSCRLDEYFILSSLESEYFVAFKRPTVFQQLEYTSHSSNRSFKSLVEDENILLHEHDSSCVRRLTRIQIEKLKTHYLFKSK